MKKGYTVNLDVLVIVDGGEEEAIKEAMRVAPLIHQEELGSENVRVCYTSEVQLCPKCFSHYILQSKETRNQKYCIMCGHRW